MWRTLVLLTAVTLSAGAGPARAAQDEDIEVRGIKLSQLLEILRGAAAREQHLAFLGAAALCPHGPSAVLVGLDAAAGEREGRRRQAVLGVVEIVGPVKSRNVLPTITRALKEDGDDRVRAAAAAVLGKMADKAREAQVTYAEPVGALTAAVKNDGSPRVREAAALALGRCGFAARTAVAALASALQDEDGRVRAASAEALGRIGGDAREALPDLVLALKDKKNDVLTRSYAAFALGRIGSPDARPAVPPLGDVVADAAAPEDVRKAAAEALGRMGKDAAPAVAALGKALGRDGPLPVRQAAAAALGRVGPEARDALPALKAALEDSDKFVRCQAAHALGQLGKGAEGVARPLLKCLADNVVEVRLAAIEAFANLGPEPLGDDAKAVTSALQAASKEGQAAVREAATEALKKFRPGP